MSEGADGQWAGSESRDWIDGRHARDNPFVPQHSGVVSARSTRAYLTKAKAAYERAHRAGWLSDEWPAKFEDSRLYRRIRRFHESETFGDRLDEGDAAGVRHHVGSQSDDVDISGLNAFDRMLGIVGKSAFMSYLWAEPGSGKTDFALLLAQLWKREHPGGLVASNIRTVEEQDRWITSYPSLTDWMVLDDEEALKGNATPKLFVFDEASSHAGGSGSDGYETKRKLGRLCYKIRKYGGSLIVIGHDGKDLHPAVRELCIAINKEGKKAATFYQSVSNRKGVDPIMSVSGVPPTDWQFNTHDLAGWDWGGDAGDEDEEAVEDGSIDGREWALWTAIKAKEQGLTDREASKFVPYSRTWVNNRWKDYCEEDAHVETLDRVESAIA